MRALNTFERIVDALGGALLDDACWPSASALIDEACGARGNVLIFEDGFPEDNIRFIFAKSYYRGEDRSAWLEEYFRTYYPVDEHFPRWRRLRDSKIVGTADLFSEEERKISIAYNEAAPRFEFDNGLSVRLDGPGGSRIIWGVANPIDSSGWTMSRVDMVAWVLPHLRQYVRVRSALVDAGALGASATELLTNTRMGVIQLDRLGCIVEMNDSARDLLRRNDGLFDAGGELHATWPDDDERLQELLAGALPDRIKQGVSGSTLLRRQSSLPRLALHLKPLSSREAGLSLPARGRAGADCRPGEPGTHRAGSRQGDPGPHVDGDRDCGDARPGLDRAPDRCGDRSPTQHGTHTSQAHVCQAWCHSTIGCGAGRPGTVEPSSILRLRVDVCVLRLRGTSRKSVRAVDQPSPATAS